MASQPATGSSAGASADHRLDTACELLWRQTERSSNLRHRRTLNEHAEDREIFGAKAGRGRLHSLRIDRREHPSALRNTADRLYECVGRSTLAEHTRGSREQCGHRELRCGVRRIDQNLRCAPGLIQASAEVQAVTVR